MSANEECKETALAAPKGEESAQEEPRAEAVSTEVQDTAATSVQEENATLEASSDPSSTSRRPLTRSQTGVVAKRRKRDDSEERAAPKKRVTAPRKKQKSSSGSGSQSSSVAPEESPSQSPRPPATREVSLASSGSGEAAPPNSSHLEFYHTSPTSEDRVECRLPRSRASLPTPIPNLTKKSRGRRVPTQPTGNSDSDKDQRLYVCTVTGCGKCFHRGEHLKRHIRSIHTHEKPFKCSFPLCQKFFNRHDNLLQHLKVHRDVVPKEGSSAPEPAPRSAPAATSASPPAPASPPMYYRRERSYSPSDEPQSPVTTSMPSNPIPRTIYNAFAMPPMPSYHNPYPSPMPYGMSDTVSLISNMAVSSLRTELPHSPSADLRGGPLQSRY